jgi:hypothetical protein
LTVEWGAKARFRGKVFLTLLLNWLIRGLTVIGGVIALVLAVPVTRASWVAMRADSGPTDLSGQRTLTPAVVQVGVAALSRAIEIDPMPPRYIARGTLLAEAASSSTMKLDAAQRTDLLRRARADFVTGLAGAPARGIDWQRLGVVQDTLEGASPILVAILFTSIEMAPRVPQAFDARLRIILDCWPLLTDQQKARLRVHVVDMWRWSRGDRRFFAYQNWSEADLLIINWFLREEPGAVQEFADLVRRVTR